MKSDESFDEQNHREYLDRKASAKFLQDLGIPVSARFLEKAVVTGGGPAFVKFGRRALYRPPTLRAWAISRMSERGK